MKFKFNQKVVVNDGFYNIEGIVKDHSLRNNNIVIYYIEFYDKEEGYNAHEWFQEKYIKEN